MKIHSNTGPLPSSSSSPFPTPFRGNRIASDPLSGSVIPSATTFPLGPSPHQQPATARVGRGGVADRPPGSPSDLSLAVTRDIHQQGREGRGGRRHSISLLFPNSSLGQARFPGRSCMVCSHSCNPGTSLRAPCPRLRTRSFLPYYP